MDTGRNLEDMFIKAQVQSAMLKEYDPTSAEIIDYLLNALRAYDNNQRKLIELIVRQHRFNKVIGYALRKRKHGRIWLKE